MLEAREILKALNSKSKWLVLYTLYKEPGLSGRKIAQKAGLSWAPVKRALDQLQAIKLIRKEGRKEGKKEGRKEGIN